jgi:hypothetical protein
MEKWKIVSLTIRCLVLANIALIAGVIFSPVSRPIAVKVFWVYKTCSLALLALVPAEYTLRRAAGARRLGLILDAFLSLLMFAIWFVISASTY